MAETSPSVGDIAVTYAERFHWKILPIWWVNDDGTCGCEGDHLSDNNLGKHPITQCVPRGFQDASSDPGIVRAWWGAFPKASPALACDASSMVVIDVDPRNDGERTMEDVEKMVDLPPTMRSRTGGGGYHLFYKDPGGKLRGKLGPGVEVKHKGYVLLPPSTHKSGHGYHWDTHNVQIADLGDAAGLLRHGSRVASPSGNGASTDTGGITEEVIRALEGAKAGDRHDAFKSLVGRLRAKRLHYTEATFFVEMAVDRADQTGHPFPLEEAMQLLDWAWQLPEGTTAEQELEEYQGYVDFLKKIDTPSSQGFTHDFLDVSNRIDALPDLLRDKARNLHLNAVSQQMVQGAIADVEFQRFKPPDGESLDRLIARPRPDVLFTIDQLHRCDTNTLITAQYKAGKTTLMLSLMRALADGVPFLDAFDTRQIEGRIGIMNYELTDDMMIEWCERVGIHRTDRVHLWNLRGYSLDLRSEAAREWMVAQLRTNDIEVWLMDPFAEAFRGDENSNTEVKEFLLGVNELKRLAGVRDLFISIHTGRAEMAEGEEHARGATKTDDWTDNRWVLTRQGEHRYLAMNGRSGELPEAMLSFDPQTSRFSLNHAAPVSRRVFRNMPNVDAVVNTLQRLGATTPESAVGRTVLTRQIREGKESARRDWIDLAADEGTIRYRDGERAGQMMYWIEGVDVAADPLSTIGSVEDEASTGNTETQ